MCDAERLCMQEVCCVKNEANEAGGVSAHSSSRKETLNRSPRQVPNSGGGPGVCPGQYAPQDDSTALAAVCITV